MGKEAKIGVAVIVGLTVCLGVAIAWRLSGYNGRAHAEAVEEREEAEHRREGHDAETPHPAPRPTIVAAKNHTGEAGKERIELGRWNPASDEASRRPAGEGKGAPSLMPNPPHGFASERADRYGIAHEPPPPKPAPGGEIEISDAEPRSAARDPFSVARDRTTLYGPTETEPGPHRPHPGESERAELPSGGYPPVAAGRTPGGYVPHRPAEPSLPPYGENSRYALEAPRVQHERDRLPPRENAQFAALRAGPRPATRDGRRDDGTYEVQPNDSYWTISEKVYGSGAYFKALAEHNRKRVPQEDRLQVGDVIATPDVEQLEKKYADLCPKPSHREAVKRPAATVSLRQHHTGRTYTTAEGDTLFDIARTELGKAARWSEIYELNREQIGPDYNYLRPGLQLALPEDESSGKVTHRPGADPMYRR